MGAIIFTEAQKQKITKVFFDLKSPNAPENLAQENATYNATSIVTTDGFNGLRTSIYGTRTNPKNQTDGKPAHPMAGVANIVDSYYANEVSAIKKALAANPNLTIFASKKLNGPGSFPNWVLDTDTSTWGALDGIADADVNPTRYAGMLLDYMEYMADKGIPTHILGYDNEREFNEGNITASRFAEIDTQLTAQLATRNAARVAAGKSTMPKPLIIAPETYTPNAFQFMNDLIAKDLGKYVDLYGVHYYPEHRNATYTTRLETDLTLAKNREKIHTELHWNSKAGVDDFAEAEDGIGSAWDVLDRGMTGMIWWVYARETSLIRGDIMRELTTRWLNYRPIYASDTDSDDILTNGKLHTRAFRNGNNISVYFVNLNNTAKPSYPIEVNNGTVTHATYIQWLNLNPSTVQDNAAPGVGWSRTTGTITPLDPKHLAVTLPAQSITLVTFTYAAPTSAFSETWAQASTGAVTGASLVADGSWTVSSGASRLSLVALDADLNGKGVAFSNGGAAGVEAKIERALATPLVNTNRITLKARIILPTATAGLVQDHVSFQLQNNDGMQAYKLSFNTNSTKTPLTLSVNESGTAMAFDVGTAGDQIVDVPIDAIVTFTRLSATQTRADYALYRNNAFWAQGSAILARALATSQLTKIVVQASNQAPLTLGQLEVLSE